MSLVSTVIHTVLTAVEHFSEQLLPDTPPLYWILPIKLLNGIGVVVTMFSTFELTMAQAPNRMRGIMMGLLLALVGWSIHGSSLAEILHIFKASKVFAFYCYLALPPLAMLMLIIYVIVAKRYKLRERERHVNIQAIVEEHYDNTLTKRRNI